MAPERYSLHILFFPGFSPGHMFPMVELAKLFAARGVRATILTTPANVPCIRQIIVGDKGSFPELISFHLIPFPFAAAGLPEGCDNSSTAPHNLQFKFLQSLHLFRNPFKEVMGELLPDCVVTDMFMPWTYEVAAEVAVPRIVFHGMSIFSLCMFDSMLNLFPVDSLPLGTLSFELPSIPHTIEMLVSQIPIFHRAGNPYSDFFKHINDADAKSYGVVVNSFSDLDPENTAHFREVTGRKVWHVGPLALCNKDKADDSDCSCLQWLDEKPPRSVVYVCFGSASIFTKAQIQEMAIGLKDSGHTFLWVVGSGGGGEDQWISEGFEKSVEGRGLIIKRWAPQLQIINHKAIGGFMTHCGWNSILEAIVAGLPMVTWPLFADQFYNERLIVQVLKIAVEVGVVTCHEDADERMIVEAELVAVGLRRLMGKGEEAEERRRRVMELGKKAREAAAMHGSSYEDVGSLIRELMERKATVMEERNGMGYYCEEKATMAEDSVGRRKEATVTVLSV